MLTILVSLYQWHKGNRKKGSQHAGMMVLLEEVNTSLPHSRDEDSILPAQTSSDLCHNYNNSLYYCVTDSLVVVSKKRKLSRVFRGHNSDMYSVIKADEDSELTGYDQQHTTNANGNLRLYEELADVSPPTSDEYEEMASLNVTKEEDGGLIYESINDLARAPEEDTQPLHPSSHPNTSTPSPNPTHLTGTYNKLEYGRHSKVTSPEAGSPDEFYYY